MPEPNDPGRLIYVKGRSTGKGTIEAAGLAMEESMKMTMRTVALAASTFACAALFSPGWSDQGGISLSIGKAEAQQRVYITRGYAARAAYVEPGSWYAVRAYYFDGPWSGPGYSYSGWADYAARNGIGCTPGTAIKGGDSIMYVCQ